MKNFQLLLTFIICLFGFSAFGQFNVYNNNNATQLAQKLAGPGVVISNATLVCPSNHAGTFVNAPVGLGIDSGIILASGKVLDIKSAAGPTTFISTGANAAGNANLNALLTSLGETYTTKDACVLDFDITVTGDSLKFSYAMGSEEYPTFVCSSVNDIFGFFISGPNPAGGNYVNQNVAIVPGTNVPVSINTVNNGGFGFGGTCYDGTYAAYMNPNTNPISSVPQIAYNQLTKKMEAKAATVPCQTYHFKLAIADGGDDVYDSGVFLEAGSFTSNAVVIGASSVLGAGFDQAIEGCVDGVFTLQLDTPYAYPVMVGFNISGTATNGVDYAFILDSVLVPAGDTLVDIFINVFTDALVEGVETVILTPYTKCGTLGTPSVLEIIDFLPSTISVSNDTLCTPAVVTLTATGAQFYSWRNPGLFTNPDSATTTTIAPLTQTTTFYMDGQLGTCSFTDSITVFVSPSLPTLNIGPISCPGANDGSLWITWSDSAVGPFSYSYIFHPGVTDSILTNLAPGFQFAQAKDGLGCTYNFNHTFANPTAFIYSFDTVGISCAGADDGSICIYNVAKGTYTANVSSNGVIVNTYNFAIDADTFCMGPLGPGSYSVAFTNDTTGCGTTFTTSLSNPSGLNYSYFANNTSCGEASICMYNLVNGNYTADVTLDGTPIPSFNFTMNSDTFCVDNLLPGLYDITLTNDNSGCSAQFTQTIVAVSSFDADIVVMGSGLCAGGNIDSLVATTIGGTPNFTYVWSSGQTTKSIQSVAFGTYSVVITDANNCVDSASVTLVAPSPMYLNIEQDSILCFGANTGIAYVDSFSGGNAPLTYSWNTTPVQSNDTAFNLFAGQYILTITDANGCTAIDTVVVLQPSDSLSVSLSTNTISCFGGDTCIEATVSGGLAPYTYLWNDAAAQTTEDICGVVAGTYSLTVTDAKGCTNTKTITVAQNAEIVLTKDSTNINCYGANNGTATVSAVGGTGNYTYLWNDAAAQTTATASNLAPGLYSVVVADATNASCTKIISVNIVQPTDSISIALASIQNVSCFGASTGAINVNVAGGTLPYTFSWSNGATTEDLIGAAANTYTLTVTDANNCSRTYTNTITQPTALVLSLANTTNVGCAGGNNGALDITVSGGKAPYTYAWSNSAATQDITGLTAGSYTVTVTDSNNCTIAGTYTISQPTAVAISFNYSNFNGKNISCNGASDGTLQAVATGGNGPYTYAWDNATTANPAINLVAGIVYTVTVTDASGCTFTKAANVLTEPEVILLNKDSVNITCAGYSDGSATAIATGGTAPYTYLWSDPAAQTTAKATNLGVGTYNCKVTDVNGCNKIIQVSIEEPSPIIVTTEMDSTQCWGDANGVITINAAGGNGNSFEYSIDGGATYQASNVFKGLTSGVYSNILVRQGGINGCVSVKVSEVVEQPDPMFVSINPEDTTIQIQESVPLNIIVDPSTGYYSGTSYSAADIISISWSPITGLNCTDCLNPTSQVYNDTEYTATVLYSQYGCETSATVMVNVENNLKFFIPNSFSPQGDGINDVHYVYGEGLKSFNISIYNRIGEKVFESSNQSVGWDGTFKGVMQNPGVFTYMFKATYLDEKEISLKGSITLIR